MMNETMTMNDEMNLDELETVAGGRVSAVVAAVVAAIRTMPVYPPVPTGHFPHPRT